MKRFNGCKVFSATMVEQRATLGDKVTAWLAAHASYEVADITVTQSSDSAFHAICICVWFWDPAATARVVAGIRR